MRKILFQPTPIWEQQSISVIRIILGLLLIYHGIEVFNSELMQQYTTWDVFKGDYANFLVYLGKTAELVAGISLTLGLFTRLGALLCVGTLAYITFFVGQGRFWYQDQHPFMFVLLGALYFFIGAGAWSLDAILFKKLTPISNQ
ncbi:MAG: DoxX family protein [Saprospiraceae bacterium]|nr:DoxX family protein [Saprospiraceae bacterium]